MSELLDALRVCVLRQLSDGEILRRVLRRTALTAADHQFLAFHVHNPAVYEVLVRLARQAKASGREKIGIKMLYEVARWELFLVTTEVEYKLNNNYHSRYARLIMAKEPDLKNIFELRELFS